MTKVRSDGLDPRVRVVHYRLAAVVIMSLLAQGCASAYLRLTFASDRPGLVTAGDERIAIPVEPYPYFDGTAFDVVCTSMPMREALRGDASAFEVASSLLLAPLTFVDLPLSGLLDTVLLPRDYVAHRRYAKAVAAHRIRERELLRRHERRSASDTERGL